MPANEKERQKTLRIIDANYNRIREGLRFLEEIARLLLDDGDLTARLKALRHDAVRGDIAFQKRLLKARDAENDVGMDGAVPGEESRKELTLLLVANAKRVQESLRVLEELAKLPSAPPELNTDLFRHARFSLYSIERDLMARLQAQSEKNGD